MIVSPTEPQGILFDIQRMSLQDGPGIRTSLFLKGCPLRCKWCHNPESYTAGLQLMYHATRCVGCGACMRACEKGVHSFAPEHTLNRTNCVACGKCVDVCCYDALSIVGKTYTVQQVLNAVVGDRPYFERRDEHGLCGGITLTGGEPMAQFTFAKAIAQAVKANGISVCMETCGFAPFDHYLEMLPYIDRFLWDWKASDPQKHLQLCGQDNRLIQENLEQLYRHGADIVIRLPMIPDVNDDTAHLNSVADWLKSHPRVREAQIMAYHRMGVDKTRQLGMALPAVDQPAADEARKQSWLRFFHEAGLTFVTIG